MKAEEGNIISVLEAEIRLVKLLMNEKMQEVMKKKYKNFSDQFIWEMPTVFKWENLGHREFWDWHKKQDGNPRA